MSQGLAVWAALFLLGAYHGINPGMGWLFAVARGMQEHRARAVAYPLPPIVLGHGLSIGVVVLVAGLAQVVLPLVMAGPHAHHHAASEGVASGAGATLIHLALLDCDRGGGVARLSEIRRGNASLVVAQSRPDMGDCISGDRLRSVTGLT